MIRFFNTLSGKLEEFKPLDPAGKEVKLYTCGPTVYDYAHIGNYRTFVFEDLLRRFLEFKGYKVKHVMNITDVDDKTIAGANREKKKLEEFTKTYLDAFHEDLKTLNILPANVKEPRATQEIPAMLDLIQKLVDKKTAYVADGSVYYRVDSFKNYGKLSKKNLEKNVKGARVNVDEYEKEEGADFVLWKKAKEGEPSWDSPWGKGRPGWHIECSAMSMKYLGESFDIHAGGEDLIFPHHENEIAQSEGATGKPFVKYWLHSKHLLVDGKKMSKKDKNYYTLRDLLKMGHDPAVIRFDLLVTHYRTSFDFSLNGLNAAKESLKRIRDFYREYKDANGQGTGKIESIVNDAKKIFEEALEDDLNTSKAVGSLFAFIKRVNSFKKEQVSSKEATAIVAFLKSVNQVLSFMSSNLFKMDVPEEIRQKVKLREKLREERKFQEADKVRKEVEDKGFKLSDEPDGTGIVPL